MSLDIVCACMSYAYMVIPYAYGIQNCSYTEHVATLVCVHMYVYVCMCAYICTCVHVCYCICVCVDRDEGCYFSKSS